MSSVPLFYKIWEMDLMDLCVYFFWLFNDAIPLKALQFKRQPQHLFIAIFFQFPSHSDCEISLCTENCMGFTKLCYTNAERKVNCSQVL